MIIHPIEAGPIDTIGYLVGCPHTRRALLIDCPIDVTAPLDIALRQHALTLGGVVLTHGHWDHLGDAAAVSTAYGIPVSAHPDDAWMIEQPERFGRLPFPITPCRIDTALSAGDRIRCGTLTLAVRHVPGHTPGHVALSEMEHGVLFAGDVLFKGGIGRTDFPGGNYDQLLRSITEELADLPDETVVYPGHGPATTLGRERGANPFIREWHDITGE